jgi:two-component system alkaline phosphatase synthesis response regulator PhoP
MAFMAGTVLLVEDDKDIVRVVRTYLERDGFTVEVAEDGLTGLQKALENPPNLIVLDWMLPGLNGLEFMQRLRNERQTPIIMLTARTEESDRVLGLELGADDYVTKPFSPRELAARVKSVLRRATQTVQATFEPITIGVMTIDPTKRSALLEGRPLELTTLEFDLLHTLAQSPGRVFTRDELLDRVWSRDFSGIDRVVDVHISNLRQKIEHDPERPHWILTVRGVGYKMAEPDS